MSQPLMLTPTQARRLAVMRQRLAGPKPEPTLEGMMEIIRDIRCVQIDPIRAVERTQFLVLWSRLGNYDPELLNTLLFEERQLFEFWAHAASIVLTEDYPIHDHTMRNFAQDEGVWSKRISEWLSQNENFRQYVLTQLAEVGPVLPTDIEDRADVPWTSTGWTNERNVDRMLGFLWWQGDVMVAKRQGLRKKWALTEHHLPDWTPRDTLSDAEMTYQSAQISLRGLGVGTAKHVQNHFIRNRYVNLKDVLAQLLADGRIQPVIIRDEANDTSWSGDWYIHSDDVFLARALTSEAWQPRTVLLSPFDNLICDRDRTELMWDFHFRIEIYVPKAKRQYGYYVLPILHGEQLIGRIDPKMDRKSGTLHINAVYAEPDAPQDINTAQAIAATITELGQFLGAKKIVYGENIAPAWQAGLPG